jgi:hypothetical protein
MSATVREYLARPRQHPRVGLLALLEELGRGVTPEREAEIVAELERLVVVEVPAEGLH